MSDLKWYQNIGRNLGGHNRYSLSFCTLEEHELEHLISDKYVSHLWKINIQDHIVSGGLINVAPQSAEDICTLRMYLVLVSD